VLISPTFYVQLFYTKVMHADFFVLDFWLCDFKKIGIKDARQVLVKLAIEIDFFLTFHTLLRASGSNCWLIKTSAEQK
jgi:hypothetical protein